MTKTKSSLTFGSPRRLLRRRSIVLLVASSLLLPTAYAENA